ncbi:MAG: phosphatase PAP2 family protein [Ignavibacteriae bacterium]|nr:phosphatase PAP2 family protein [Ignavibacteriota bacterium]
MATCDTVSVGRDLSGVVHSVGNVLISPLRWDGGDALIAGGFVIAATGSFLLDDEMREVMLRNTSKLNDNLERIGFSYGAPQYAGPGAVAVYLSGIIADNRWLRETGLMLAETIISTGIIQVPLKIITGRARPEANKGNHSFMLFKGVGQERSSFFSGHAMIAFGYSTVLARQIDNVFATIGLYGLAALTPLARMYRDRHWLSDAFIGSALGVFVGNTIVNSHRGLESGDSGLLILPTGVGVSITMRF